VIVLRHANSSSRMHEKTAGRSRGDRPCFHAMPVQATCLRSDGPRRSPSARYAGEDYGREIE
jgi:hypothetical protein